MREQLVIRQGLVHDAVHRSPYMADILVEEGKIKKILPKLEEDTIKNAKILDAAGLWVYPGFVEAHCHLGLDGYGIGFEGADYNEVTDSLTPQLSAVDGLNPQDESIRFAMEAGVTCVAAGPGSSNVLGGTFTVYKTVGKRIDDMIVKERAAMKCAFGENPKVCYKEKDNYSRMSTASKIRIMLMRTREYLAKQEAAGEDIWKRPPYDPKLEALIPVIQGTLPLKAHVHQANDIYTAIRIAKEFHVGLALDHCTDGSLIADDLAKEGYPVAVGPSLGHATKFELKNKSFATPGDLVRAGCQVSIITDSPVIPQQYLALCAGLAVKSGMDEFEALKAITIQAARHIGVQDRVGSLEVGKDADLVIAAGNPLVSDTKIQFVIIDGKVTYSVEK
ncbi:MAG: amidohydrolase [Lachnospiraceae bacterium]|jgi:imidazolonepropionase-like amidohydrolase|nr:amidohydrolase [Lachnospiraceae bacterium]